MNLHERFILFNNGRIIVLHTNERINVFASELKASKQTNKQTKKKMDGTIRHGLFTLPARPVTFESEHVNFV